MISTRSSEVLERFTSMARASLVNSSTMFVSFRRRQSAVSSNWKSMAQTSFARVADRRTMLVGWSRRRFLHVTGRRRPVDQFQGASSSKGQNLEFPSSFSPSAAADAATVECRSNSYPNADMDAQYDDGCVAGYNGAGLQQAGLATSGLVERTMTVEHPAMPGPCRTMARKVGSPWRSHILNSHLPGNIVAPPAPPAVAPPAVAPPAGLEPATHGLGNRRSIL